MHIEMLLVISVIFNIYACLFLHLDLDECQVDNGGCDHVCDNQPIGSFTCACREGFALNPDSRACSGKIRIMVFRIICQDILFFVNVFIYFRILVVYVIDNTPTAARYLPQRSERK